MTEIYMLVGVPASGKSRAVETELRGAVCLSRDKEGGRVRDLVPKMTEAISQGAERIALDCTFVRRDDRAPFVAAAASAGVPIHCWFSTQPPISRSSTPAGVCVSGTVACCDTPTCDP